MREINDLINELRKFPDGSMCEAYEGECTGISIVSSDRKNTGFIHCSNKKEEPETEAYGTPRKFLKKTYLGPLFVFCWVNLMVWVFILIRAATNLLANFAK